MSSRASPSPLTAWLRPGAEPVPGFHLVEALGAGGFGEVWKAATDTGFHVALKFVRIEGERGSIEQRSLSILKSIRHPNLLPTFNAWELEGYLVLCMELADCTLFQRYQEAVKEGFGGIPLEELLEYCREAGKGIDYLNAYSHRINDLDDVGVQHRDIKPHNILLVGNGVKVADFGLARLLQGSVTSNTGLMTIHYAPPEFFHGRTTTQSDQYSLAITYCEMRTGKRPFSGTKIEQIMHAHCELPPDLSMLPPDERPVVARALSKSYKDRYKTCREFTDALWSSAGQFPINTAAPSRSDTPSGIRLPPISTSVSVRPEQFETTDTALVPNEGALAETRLASRISNSLGMELVLLPHGVFTMGTPSDIAPRNEDELAHEVEINRNVYLGVYPVTQEQFQHVMGSNPSWFTPAGKGASRVENIDIRNLPVESVSWEDAMAFCRKLSNNPDERTFGRSYRLPTEAEWEYACRSGMAPCFIFYFGESLSSQDANFNGSRPGGKATRGPFLGRPVAVGSYQPHGFGVYDMHGNVAEWCHDWYDKTYYARSPRENPQGPDSSPMGCRVIRGGSWNSMGTGCRSAERNWSKPTSRSSDVGFRIAMELSRHQRDGTTTHH